MSFAILFVLTITKSIICDTNIILTINQNNPPIYISDEKFFSVALDTSVIANHFNDFNMQNNRLQKLIKELSPGYLRIGGNMADRLYFSRTFRTIHTYNFNFLSNIEICSYEEYDNYYNFPNFTMSGKEWIQINRFAKKLNMKILFDLNCLIRNDDGSWNSKNAEELISFSNEYGFNIDWQLGNEPDAFKHVFNYVVNASQLATDFYTLRNILNKYPRYRKSFLVGPDVTRPTSEHPASAKYLKQFLQSVHDSRVLKAITFHQYYLNGRTANMLDFLNPRTFHFLQKQISTVKSIVKNTRFTETPIWLTETSSAYGGGAPGLSNTFVGSFLWLDKLGLSAKNNLKIVIRQSIKRNYYALIDEYYNPNPDWWLSILFKKFVGPKILNCNTVAPDTVRLYCHCSSYSQIQSVVVFGINISNKTMYVEIQGVEKSYLTYAYILTAQGGNLTTKNVLLNENLLELTKDGDLPQFKPKEIILNKNLKMPAYSLIFWIIPVPNMKFCMRPNIFII